jgi:mono/diheme cytochrome c family protein
MRDLKASGWEPSYFEGTVRTFPDGHHLELARRALAQPTTMLTVGGFDYRTSPGLIAAGREIFRNYHFGSHLYWDFRRVIDHATGVSRPEEYDRVYGVKRDAQGYFVGIVGVQRANGDVEYGHSCALCHSNVDAERHIVDGAANHDYDIGLYYDALRPKISDPEAITLGDSPLEALRHSGPGRTDSTVDSHWAPMRVPHLYALRAFEHGVRANGDMPNLWIQCYRNLNANYAVDSEIMEAVMAYMLSLTPPPNPRARGEREARGQAVFEAQRCHRCHLPPYYSDGQVVDWQVIRTDPDRIHNGFPKGYKVASLLRLDQYRFYLHDGSLTELSQLFDPARLQPSYEAPGIPPGRRKPGTGVPGHMFGMRLSPEDRAALVAWLQSL